MRMLPSNVCMCVCTAQIHTTDDKKLPRWAGPQYMNGRMHEWVAVRTLERPIGGMRCTHRLCRLRVRIWLMRIYKVSHNYLQTVRILQKNNYLTIEICAKVKLSLTILYKILLLSSINRYVSLSRYYIFAKKNFQRRNWHRKLLTSKY